MESTVFKSENDKNLYKAFTLQNGLKVLLISDQTNLEDNIPKCENGETDAHDKGEYEDSKADDDIMSDDDLTDGELQKKKKLAAASLCVNVGSFSDPEKDLPGLAHFVEHMIFMGSEKYPDENAYDSFVSAHGGSTNAYTDTERTIYFLEIIPEYFKHALDIFANCFISPLFRTDAVDREIESIDSEFSMVAPSDSERFSLILRTLTKPGHPMGKFMWGNKKSLKDIPKQNNFDVVKAVIEFYKRYYSAHHMTLAVQSIESLEKLEEWVQEIFAAIPNTNLPVPCFDELQNPFDAEKFHKIYKVSPVKEIHKLHLTWALPTALTHYRTKPIRYIEMIVAHEGKGSILSHLRKKSWAVDLEAGSYESGMDFNSTCSLFFVDVKLTESGMDNIFEVITEIFQYMKMLIAEGPKEYIFKELQAVQNQIFAFQEQVDAIEYVSQLAVNMQVYPCSEYIVGGKLYFDYDEELIRQFINEMSWHKANIAIFSHRFTKEESFDHVEQWTNCQYTCKEIPQDWLTHWNNLEFHPSFHLPEENKFIATDFNLKHEESDNKFPYKILQNDQCCLWFKEDTKFNVPKAFAFFHLICPSLQQSTLNSVLFDLFLKLLAQKLSEETYSALMANLSYDIQFCYEGFDIKVYGFNDKLAVMLETVLDNIVNFEVDESAFHNLKDDLIMQYINMLLKPYKLSKCLEAVLLLSRWSGRTERLNIVHSITIDMFDNFVQKHISKVFVEGLIQGNITKDEALALNQMVLEKLNLRLPDPSSEIHCRELLPGKACCRVASFNMENTNTVVTYFCQIGLMSLKNLCMVELLVSIMFEPCFDKLRTNEQLGYDVSCYKREWFDVLGFAIEVQSQSDKFSSKHIEKRIEIFLHEFLDDTVNISEEKYKDQLESLVEAKKQADLNLGEEVNENWYKVEYRKYDFDLKEKQVEFLEQLEREQFTKWLKEELCENGRETLKRLIVHVIGPEDECLSEDVKVKGKELLLKSKNVQPIELQVIMNNYETNSSVNYITNIEKFKNSLAYYPRLKVNA